jgi:peptide/nickel transport system permease protein
MAQRICIAVALAGRPKLLVADEPTTALDVTVQAEVLNLLRRICDETGMAVLIITHDLGVIADICQRAVVMYAGEVAEFGTVDEVMTSPAHPYTQALLGANPIFAEEGEALPSIPGTVTPPSDWPIGCHFADRCPFQVAECLIGPIPLLDVGTSHLCRCPYGPRVIIEIERRVHD